MKTPTRYWLLLLIFICITLFYLSEMQDSKNDLLILSETSLYCKEFSKSIPELSDLSVFGESSSFDHPMILFAEEANPDVYRRGSIPQVYQVYRPVNEDLLNGLKPELIIFLKAF